MANTRDVPLKIIITGGREFGGVSSFAEGLRAGFTDLGLPVEVVSPLKMLKRPLDLRNPKFLKILSLAAIFAAPIARRALCVAHGLPCALHQGWPTAISVLAALRIATMCSGAQLVTVSDYSALHLRALFGLRIDATIRNPVLPLFLEPLERTDEERIAITFVGALHPGKNLHRLLPAIRDVLDDYPGMRAWIVGDGPMRGALERIAAGDARVEFLGALPMLKVRERLRCTRVLISACTHEALGIAYIEGLSQGCAVAMPVSGGGLEIAPQLINGLIQLFSPNLDRESVAAALRRALVVQARVPQLSEYSARKVAEAYLAADARFSATGLFRLKAAA